MSELEFLLPKLSTIFTQDRSWDWLIEGRLGFFLWNELGREQELNLCFCGIILY